MSKKPETELEVLYTPARPYLKDDFKSTEDSRRIGIEAVHRTLMALAELPLMNAEDLDMMKIALGILDDVEQLEIKRYVVMNKDKSGRPDPERAANIASGVVPSDPMTKKEGGS